ncbi:MAG: DUF3618 domain-containing protein [Candidatus Nanopelagicales bacterium]|jgi:hypothetical protein
MTEAVPTPAAPATEPSVVDIQAEIAAAREELVASLSDLRAATTPAALAQRGGRSVAGWFTDEYGGVRPERVAIAVGVVVGLVVLRRLVRRR